MMGDDVMRLCNYDLTLLLACVRDRYPLFLNTKVAKTQLITFHRKYVIISPLMTVDI